jgi:HK97 family phage prohead protease
MKPKSARSRLEPNNLLLHYGAGIKQLGGNRFGGYGVIFSTEYDPDLEHDFFTSETEFWLKDRVAVPLLFSHGLDETIGKRRIGTMSFKQDSAGVWFEGILDQRDAYIEKILELIKKGVLGFSTAALSHLVERIRKQKGVNWVKTWPIFELSLTPTPAEPRTLAQSLKHYYPISFEKLRTAGLSPLDVQKERFEILATKHHARSQEMRRSMIENLKQFNRLVLPDAPSWGQQQERDRSSWQVRQRIATRR